MNLKVVKGRDFERNERDRGEGLAATYGALR
jgi:hypothetical protein